MNILAVYQKQGEKTRHKALVAVFFLSISTPKVLTGWEMTRVAVLVLGLRRQISNGQRFAALSGDTPPFHRLTEYPLPIAKVMFHRLTESCSFLVEEPVSTHAAWTSIYT